MIDKVKLEQMITKLVEVGYHLNEMTELLRQLAEELHKMREGDKQPSLFE